jgi:hypothetical protein
MPHELRLMHRLYIDVSCGHFTRLAPSVGRKQLLYFVRGANPFHWMFPALKRRMCLAKSSTSNRPVVCTLAPGYWFALSAFSCLIDGFRSRDLRQRVAALLGVGLEQYSASQMTYDLRRLRRKGIICRVSGSQRCYLTPYGWKLARLYARLEARVFRPVLTVMNAPPIAPSGPLSDAVQTIDTALNRSLSQAFPTRKAA